MTTTTTRRPVLKLLAAPGPCRVCGLPAMFAKLGGQIPLHPMCDPRAWLADPDPEVEVEALGVIATVLGPITIATDPPVRPEDIGSCVSCGRPIRRYGPWAITNRCQHCRA